MTETDEKSKPQDDWPGREFKARKLQALDRAKAEVGASRAAPGPNLALVFH